MVEARINYRKNLKIYVEWVKITGFDALANLVGIALLEHYKIPRSSLKNRWKRNLKNLQALQRYCYHINTTFFIIYDEINYRLQAARKPYNKNARSKSSTDHILNLVQEINLQLRSRLWRNWKNYRIAFVQWLPPTPTRTSLLVCRPRLS